MSDQDSSSYTSGSDGESYESSSSEEVVLKPVFLTKDQRRKTHVKSNVKQDNAKGPEGGNIDLKPTGEVDRRKEIALSKAGHEMKVETGDGDDFDGVDDADDLNPEQEYEEWQRREKERYQRDRERMAYEERTKDDKVRRENLTEQELIDDFNARQKEQPSQDESRQTKYPKGAFFGDNESISNLLKRTHTQTGDDGDDDYDKDHSRPTRLKFN